MFCAVSDSTDSTIFYANNVQLIQLITSFRQYHAALSIAAIISNGTRSQNGHHLWGLWFIVPPCPPPNMNRPAIRLALGCSDFALGKMWEIVCHFGLKDPIDSIWRFPKMGVTMGNPKSSIFIGFSIINHSFWGTHIYRNLIETSMRSFALRHHVFATATKSPAITTMGHVSQVFTHPLLRLSQFLNFAHIFFHTCPTFSILFRIFGFYSTLYLASAGLASAGCSPPKSSCFTSAGYRASCPMPKKNQM